MARILAALAALVVVFAFPRWSLAQFDEEADLIPGLLGAYMAADRSVEVIDVTLSHGWGTSAADPRLPAGPFQVRWQSQLLLREETSYTFHAYVQGAVSVVVDGEEVLVGERQEPGWISGDPVDLSFGLWELEVAYRKTEPSAEMHLYWSSEGFPLEPIPPHLLFRAEGRPDLAERERGRQLYAAHRCNRCHRREDEPLSPPAPSLVHGAAGMQDGWLVQKLLNRDASSAHARMPSFGFSVEQASDIVAYLRSIAEPVQLAALPAVPTGKKRPPAGDLLVKSVGCLACHTFDGVGQLLEFGGGDLSAIGGKRTAEWLFHWLSDPRSLNADHRMPLIKLSDAERTQIARELGSRMGKGSATAESAALTAPDREAARRGRALVERSRCAACHRISKGEASLDGVPSLAKAGLNWDRSCLGPLDGDHKRPSYPNIDGAAIRSYVESRSGPLSAPSSWARGRAVLEQRNCLGCHERDLSHGIVPVAGRIAKSDDRFRGQSQSLIPPSLTAVGDKLHDLALTLAVRGEQKRPRLPWLQVKMPRFDHAEADQSALVRYLIEHDRIPDGAPGTTPSDQQAAGDSARKPGEQALLTGHALIGAGGFNCVACHKFGDYEPRNVALGTKGCDLLMIKDRMRAEFFHRWTRAPLRVIPGMEMPNFNKPVAGLLDEDVDRQLAAVWRAVNDPQFTAPTNPTQVEQYLIVKPGDPPQIVRDVFTIGENNGGGYVARPLAVGFGNGHSLLFDLDRLSLRGWTLGDFARQRTEGKSWFWDLAGVGVVTGFDEGPDFVLNRIGTRELAYPINDGGRVARLTTYSSADGRVVFEQVAEYPIDGEIVAVTIVQELSEHAGNRASESGVSRAVTASSIPDGWQLILKKPSVTLVLRGAAITADGPDWESQQPGEKPLLGWILTGADGTGTIRQSLLATATRHVTTPKPKADVPLPQGDVVTLPGMIGRRLPLSSEIMPTAIAVLDDGRLVFTSLKGHVYAADDADGDGLADELTELERGLAAPFGVLPFRGGILVSHKPELLWLADTDGSRPVTRREVWADGWGYSEDYHDWTTGPVADEQGNLYLGIGSNYSQQGRSPETSRWRGKVLKVGADRRARPFAHELRYPQGIAFDGEGRLFVSDQQGVANPFNEINHILAGHRYGVRSLYDEQSDLPETRASVQIPHPLTRSVNGIFFLPKDIRGPLAPFGGHGVGCEYNGRFLVRFSLQDVGGQLQGACYYLSRPNWENDAQTFLGPMCGTATASGEVYIGSIFDSGWLGGPNTGEIVRLAPRGDIIAPNGIRELRATSDGFEIEFLRPVDRAAGVEAGNYVLSGYTRVWQGSYATPDSGRYTPQVTKVEISPDGRTVRLSVDELREHYVYEVNTAGVAAEDAELFPATGHYAMNRIPSSSRRTNGAAAE